MVNDKKYIACIGARKTPPDILSVMRNIGYKLACKGRHLRYGGAEGADQAFQRGVEDYCNEQQISAKAYQSVYLPYDGFKGYRESKERGIINFKNTINYKKAVEIAKKHYRSQSETENWPEWLRLLMGRNTYQILGEDLRTHSMSVICYTPDGSLDGVAKSSGGTGQALRIASYYSIPVFNLKNERHLSFVKEHILGQKNNHEIKHNY